MDRDPWAAGGDGPALTSPDLASWNRRHLAALLSDDSQRDSPQEQMTLGDLVAGPDPHLAVTHRHLVDDGTPPAAAATYLAGWYAGVVGTAVGHALAAGRFGLLCNPTTLRWSAHPDGWCDGLDISRCAVVVEAGHPWADRPDVDVVEETAMIDRAVDTLVTTVEPIIDACRSLANVGRAGLWNEVGDALGLSLTYQTDVVVDERMEQTLRHATSHPSKRWKATPSLRSTHSDLLGTVHVGQKGGCCLAYTVPATPGEEPHGYCTPCSFRDPEDCDQLQVDWLEQHREEPGGSDTSRQPF